MQCSRGPRPGRGCERLQGCSWQRVLLSLLVVFACLDWWREAQEREELENAIHQRRRGQGRSLVILGTVTLPPHLHTHTHTHTPLHTHTSTHTPPHLHLTLWPCVCSVGCVRVRVCVLFPLFLPPPPTKHRHAVWFAHNLLCLVAIRQLAPFWFLERAKLTLARALQVRLAFEAALMSHLREKKETKEIAPQSQICLWRKREKSKEKGKKKRRVQSQSSHKQGVSVR